MLISLWEVCQERGGQEGGYLEDVEVPDQTNGRWGHPRCHQLYFFTLRYLQSKNRVALLEVIPKEFCAP